VKRSFVVGLIAIFALLGGPQAASAEISAVFSDNPYLDHGAPGGVECEVQGPGDNEGQRWCGTGQHNANNGNRSTVETFDGVPIDVNVAFPPAPESGPDGPWPLMMVFHGYGGGKINFPSLQRWIDRGFAVFSMSNRGFHESCGTTSSRSADPDCPTPGPRSGTPRSSPGCWSTREWSMGGRSGQSVALTAAGCRWRWPR
jgi:hypothetical protein